MPFASFATSLAAKTLRGPLVYTEATVPNYLFLILLWSFAIVMGALDALTVRVQRGRWTLRSKLDLVGVAILLLLVAWIGLFNRNDPSLAQSMTGGLGWEILTSLVAIMYLALVINAVRLFRRALRQQRSESRGPTTLVANDGDTLWRG